MTFLSSKRLVAVAALSLVAFGPASTASAAPVAGTSFASYASAVPGLAPAGATSGAVYLDEQGHQLSTAGDSPSSPDPAATGAEQVALFGCTPYSGRDDPHYSSGDVSGHGYWKKGSCSASTAHVINCLYEYYTDNSWRRKACSSKEKLKPYTGSGQRTVARATCNPSSGYISWRNHVDVDVDGQIDTAEEPYNQADVVCVVY